MADEGGFPFKLQGLFKASFAPPCRSRESLPAAPDGMEWVQNEDGKKDWRLVKISTHKEPELVTEEKTFVPVTPEAKRSTDDEVSSENVVDNLPAWHETGFKEDDWELLSDRLSSSSNQTPSVVIHPSRSPHSGSIRSLSSMEGGGKVLLDSLNATTLSVPFKIQRTTSNSTIDSTDNALGPLGKGVLGVDYVEHVVLPTDTLQGICLAYKISSTRLRQANCFSGNSLLLAPNKLVIPISKKALRSGFIRVQDTDAKEYKLHAMIAEFPDLSMTEAKAYLELADWVLKDARRSAKEDGEWEREMEHFALRSGEIRITSKLKKGILVGLETRGAGIHPQAQKPKKTQVTPYTEHPTISTKTVTAQDVYSAVPQHNNFGVEMQSLGAAKHDATQKES